MVYFKKESHVASCKTLDGAMKLVCFMQERFNNPKYTPSFKFRAVMETDGKISVHSSYSVNDRGRLEFKNAIAEFLTTEIAALV